MWIGIVLALVCLIGIVVIVEYLVANPVANPASSEVQDLMEAERWSDPDGHMPLDGSGYDGWLDEPDERP